MGRFDKKDSDVHIFIRENFNKKRGNNKIFKA